MVEESVCGCCAHETETPKKCSIDGTPVCNTCFEGLRIISAMNSPPCKRGFKCARKNQNGVHKRNEGTRASSCQVDSGSGGYNPNLGAVESGLYPTENREKDKDGEKSEVEQG